MRIEAYTQIQQIYNNTKPANSQKTSKSSFSDAVQISSLGKEYQIAKQAVKNTPDVRADLTSSLKSAIDNGTYNVSDEDIADKLLEKYSAILG